MPAPALKAQAAVFTLPTGARILPILLAHGPLDRALHACGEAQLEEIRLAPPLGFAHHRLIAETEILAIAKMSFREPVSFRYRTGLRRAKTEIGKWRAKTGTAKPRVRTRNPENPSLETGRVAKMERRALEVNRAGPGDQPAERYPALADAPIVAGVVVRHHASIRPIDPARTQAVPGPYFYRFVTPVQSH